MGKVYKRLRSQVRKELKQYQTIGSNPWLDLQQKTVRQRFLVYQFSGREDFRWLPEDAVKTSMLPHLCVVASRRNFTTDSLVFPYKRLRKIRVLSGGKIKIFTPAKPKLSLVGMLAGFWGRMSNKANGRGDNTRPSRFQSELTPNRFYLVQK